MFRNGGRRGWPMDQPVGWIVVRRRGGWNAQPEVVRFHEKETTAFLDTVLPHMSDFDPPADGTDVFTCHAVLPPKWPVTLPWEYRPRGDGDQAGSPDEGGRKRLVLQRWTDDTGVLILEERWVRFRQIERALQEASTWGEFEDALPSGEFDSLSLWEINDGRNLYRRDGSVRYTRPGTSDSDPPDGRIIDSSDEFHSGYVPGYEDGDYPPWIQNLAEDLPDVFLEEFGHQATSMVSGVWWEYPLFRAPEMSVALREIGYELALVATDWL